MIDDYVLDNTVLVFNIVYLLPPLLLKLYNLECKHSSESLLVKLYLPSQAFQLNLEKTLFSM